MSKMNGTSRCLTALIGVVCILLARTETSSAQDANEEIIRVFESMLDEFDRDRDLEALRASDFPPPDPQKEALGRLLFHDKILSGNLNISCATCHHTLTDTGDGLSLSVGEGAVGLGVTRNTGEGYDAIVERVPRNAPHVFNLGATDFTRMFYDGRVEVDPMHPSGFRSPAGDLLPLDLDNVLAAQAMFPVTSPTEMAGQTQENDVGRAAEAGDVELVWAILAKRLRKNAEYAAMFIAAFDDIRSASDIDFAHAANAIAAYEASAFRADDSPFDRFLSGNHRAMSRNARQGMNYFYGKAGCFECHPGTLQTDHEFYAIGIPQIGPGKGDSLPGYDDGYDDFGRERVTGDPDDRFRFRVPSLRNVALTGPWGHDGAYNTLEAVVRHHLDPYGSLASYDPSQAVLPSRDDLDAIDFLCFEDPVRRAALADAIELQGGAMSDEVVARLLDFLHALTDPASLDLRHEFPMEVPSGLPVYD